MIKIIVATPKGELLNKDVESIVVSGDTGQIGILTNRIPLLTKITKGFVKVNDLQNESLKYVSAKSQSDHLERLINTNFLTEEEIEIVKRGRNMSSHKSKNTDIITYKRSTGLECLIGSLRIDNKNDRIKEIMEFIVGE